MKALIAVIVVVIVGFFAVPMVAQGTTNTCQALERHSVADTATNIAGSNAGVVHNVINSVGQAAATGDVASTAEAQDHPNSPTTVSCTYSYWKSIL
jgi:predicted PurR-regulated permease PerM